MNYIDELEMLNREKNDRINHENLLVSDMENELTFLQEELKINTYQKFKQLMMKLSHAIKKSMNTAKKLKNILLLMIK